MTGKGSRGPHPSGVSGRGQEAFSGEEREADLDHHRDGKVGADTLVDAMAEDQARSGLLLLRAVRIEGVRLAEATPVAKSRA
ncbi:hypothetical protein, partial [Phenylobacterium sp.]|uniref:hypothetical protein n=1 Tax=Phenylobacterium sp. TaxID=1871053 RepID=UPI0025E7B490